jgi:hypothetical protein
MYTFLSILILVGTLFVLIIRCTYFNSRIIRKIILVNGITHYTHVNCIDKILAENSLKSHYDKVFFLINKKQCKQVMLYNFKFKNPKPNKIIVIQNLTEEQLKGLKVRLWDFAIRYSGTFEFSKENIVEIKDYEYPY